MTEIEKMDLESLDVVDERLERMRELFPEVFGESGIDFEKLRLELGDAVDDGDERYAFTWPGKRDAIRQAQVGSNATLRPCLEKSRGRSGKDGSFDSGNLYIEGDNLEVLKLLQRGYHGKVKMIYIDPPYNTGRDFVYHDSFGDGVENYKLQTGLSSQSNADISGRYHSKWCSMIYPRIKLARELLREDGIIFVSINDIEASNLKTICDEIFGSANFVADLIWSNKEGGGSSDSKLFRIKHEHIFCYAKEIGLVRIKGVPITNEERYKEVDEYVNERGPYYLQKLGMGSIQYSASLDYPIEAPDGTLINPSDNNHGKKACWRWSREKYLWGKKESFIVIKKDSDGAWTVYTKQYLNCDNEGNAITRTQRPMGIIDQFSSTQASKHLDSLGLGECFNYSKPVQLINFLIDRCVDEGIVLDFFAGSSTTAESVITMNSDDMGDRKFILVQLPETVSSKQFDTLCALGEERIRRAGSKVIEEVEALNRQLRFGEQSKGIPDVGFRVFTLDESGIQKPREGQLLLNRVKRGRSDFDIVFEMMLKWGLELTLPIEKEEASGYSCYSVAYGELVCCLAPGLTVDALEAIAEIEPRRVFILDRILDDSLKLNAIQIFKRVEERTGREVELRTV